MDLGGALAKLVPENDSFHAVERYTHSLLEDLGLPAEAAVQYSAAPHTTPKALGIWIDDQPCRLPLSGADVSEPATLLRCINLALHANRELFASERVLESLWHAWTGRAGPCPTDTGDALRLLVHLGISLRHAQAMIGDGTPNLPPDLAAEKVVAHSAGEFRITVDPAVYATLRFAGGTEEEPDVPQRLRLINDGLFWELGLLFPLGAIVSDSKLATDEYCIQINDLHMPPQPGLAADEFLVNDTVDRLTLLNIQGRAAINPANGSECAIITGKANAAICKQADLTTWDRQDFLILSASAAIRQTAECFLTTDSVDFSCAKLAEAFPDLVARALEAFSPIFLTRVQRTLLREGISVRDLRSILESLLAYTGRTHVDFNKYTVFYLDLDSLSASSTGFGGGVDGMVQDNAEATRITFKRWITHKYTRGGNTLVVYLLDSAVEQRLTDPTPLLEDDRAKLIDALFEEIGHPLPTAPTPVILTSPPVRARLRREIEHEFPHVAVVSYQELVPDINVQPMTRISLDWAATPTVAAPTPSPSPTNLTV